MKVLRNIEGKVKVVFEENEIKDAWANGWVRTFELHKGWWVAVDNEPVHTMKEARAIAKVEPDASLLADWEWGEGYYEWALRSKL